MTGLMRLAVTISSPTRLRKAVLYTSEESEMGRLREFVIEFAKLLDDDPVEEEILSAGSKLLGDLVRHDDWLPPAFAECHPSTYRQYLLHCDSCERFSLVSFVWG